jgi:hypothetical protein
MIRKSLTTKRMNISIPVESNTNILHWIVSQSLVAHKANRKSLTADLRKELTEIFGKQNKERTLEFRSKCWFLEFKGLNFAIYSAAGKGTSIETCDFSYDNMYNRKGEKEIIEFLTELDNSLLKLSRGKKIKNMLNDIK